MIADFVKPAERSPDCDCEPPDLHALPVAQRSCVILMDVLGHSLRGISR